MHYEIKRAYSGYGPLTPQQRTSSLFAEEPVVLGKVLRRGSAPLKVSPELFEANKVALLRLEKAGSILIVRPPVEQEVVAGDGTVEVPKDQIALSPSTGEPPPEIPNVPVPPVETAPVVDAGLSSEGDVHGTDASTATTEMSVVDAATSEVTPAPAPVEEKVTRRRKKE